MAEPPHHQSDGPLLERARDIQREALHRQVLELASSLEELRGHIDDKLEVGRQRMARIETDLRENTRITVLNTAATQTLQAATAGLMGWLKAFEGAFKVLNGFAALAKPMGIIAAALATIAGVVVGVWHFFFR